MKNTIIYKVDYTAVVCGMTVYDGAYFFNKADAETELKRIKAEYAGAYKAKIVEIEVR